MREKWKLDTIENEDLLSFPTLLLSTKSWITKWWTRKSKKRFWIICQLNLYSSKSTRARLKCNQRRKSLESCQKSFPRATTVKRFQNVSTVPIFVHRPTSQTTKNHKLATPKLEEEKTLWNWKSRSSEGSLGTWPSTAIERRTIERIWRASRNLWSSRRKCWSSYHSGQTLCDGSMHRVSTVFENHRKSLIQHCERSELRLQIEWTIVNYKCQKWSILASFWKPEACGPTVLPDRSILIGQIWWNMPKFKYSNDTFLRYFQTM